MVYTVEQIQRITAPIAASYGVKSMHLFGSYARGEATEDSDVDILVDRGRIRSAFTMGGFYADLSEQLGKKLDLVTKQGASGDFLKTIGDDTILLYHDPS